MKRFDSAPRSMSVAPMNIKALLDSLPEWKRQLARPVLDATYSAAIGMSDEEIATVVKVTLVQARKDLSS